MGRVTRTPHAEVVAALALFIALSGVSYAAVKIPAKTVGTKQLKRNAVTGEKVADGSLSAADFGARQLPAGPAGPTGSIGPAGARGATGPSGARGATGAIGATGAQGQTGPSTTAVMSGRVSSIGAGASVFFGISGDAPSVAAVGTSVEMLSPATPVTAANLSIRLTVAPGAGASRTFVLVDDASDTTLGCTVSDAQTACQDTSHSPTISPGSRLLFKAVNGSGSAAATTVMFGFTLGP